MDDNSDMSPAVDPAVESPPSNTCPDCGSRLEVQPDERWCPQCGLIITDEPEVAAPGALYGAPTPSANAGSSRRVERASSGASPVQRLTEIGHLTSTQQDTLSDERRATLTRLKTQQRRSYYKSEADRTRTEAKRTLQRISGALGLNETIEEQAAELFNTIHDDGFVNGRLLDTVASACIYATARINRAVIRFEELSQVTRADETAISSMYNTLQVEYSLPIPPRRPQELIPLFVSETPLTSEHESAATNLLDIIDIDNSSLTLSASTTAAATLSLVCSGTACPRLRTLAEAASVSPATISRGKNQIKDLCKVEGVHVPAVEQVVAES